MASELFFALLNTAAIMLCVSFLAYVLMIVVPYLRHQAGVVGDGTSLRWHFVLPCLDEEQVIEGTIRSLVATFPTAAIWCVDDGSSDATPRILAALSARWRQVRVVTRVAPEAQQGKGPALNAGWRAVVEALPARTDPATIAIGVLDADARLDPRCLDVITGPTFFGDPEVGAVQVQVRVRPDMAEPNDRRPVGSTRRSRTLVRLQDLEFSGPIAAMQLLRRRVGSVAMGGNGQFTRLSVLNRIADEHGTPWHGCLLEDFELGIHVLLSGSRTEYCHDTSVTQEGLPHLRLLLRQRSRWAQGSMQCFRYLVPVLRSPRVDTRGALEIAYFLFLPWLQLVGALVYAGSTVVAAYYALTLPGGPPAWLAGGAWGVIPLFVVFGVAPFVIWGPIYAARTDPDLGRIRAAGVGGANWIYSYLNQVAVWWAFLRLVSARRDWKKTSRVATAAFPRSAWSSPPLRPSYLATVPAITPIPSGTGVLTMARSERAVLITGRFHRSPPSPLRNVA